VKQVVIVYMSRCRDRVLRPRNAIEISAARVYEMRRTLRGIFLMRFNMFSLLREGRVVPVERAVRPMFPRRFLRRGTIGGSKESVNTCSFARVALFAFDCCGGIEGSSDFGFETINPVFELVS